MQTDNPTPEAAMVEVTKALNFVAEVAAEIETFAPSICHTRDERHHLDRALLAMWGVQRASARLAAIQSAPPPVAGGEGVDVAADAPECAKSCADPRWCTDTGACWRTNEYRDGAVRSRALTTPATVGTSADGVGAENFEPLDNPVVGEGEYRFMRVEHLPQLLRFDVDMALSCESAPHVIADARNIIRMAARELESRLDPAAIRALQPGAGREAGA